MLCRPGFEPDCAAEMDQRAARHGLAGYARARSGDGFLSWHAPGQDISALAQPVPVFTRSLWPLAGEFGPLPAGDRISPLLRQVASADPVQQVWLEHADTNDGRSMQRFLRGFRKALEARMRAEGLIVPARRDQSERILHLYFHDSARGVYGVSGRDSACGWENGIPRLRLPASAPSRSALKLEEAMLRLLPPPAREQWLAHGRQAVDLGAAPGGWTWFLARRGVRVTAVDHGAMDARLLAEYPVEHVTEDAFTWRPPAAVDWVVCDVVDKPARTLALMAKWLRLKWARAACFNLKLPMKRRFAAVEELLARLTSELRDSDHQIRASHLYHDREEVTVLVAPAEFFAGDRV